MGAQSDSSESACEEVNCEKELIRRKKCIYQCDFEGCSAFFSKPSRLKQHRCKHTGERPFKCDRPNCDRSYTHACHLKRHITTNHTSDLFKKTFKCAYPGCELSLSNESNLKRHYQRKHEKSLICKECGKSFTKNHHLRAHMISHTGVLSFRCQECNIGFASGRMLRKHQRCHKKHACNIKDCTEEFQKWTELRRHLKVAHPLEFICAICKKKFKSKGNITHHVKTHLPDRPSFPCPYPDCKRSYVSDTYLRNHIKWFHEGVGFKCTYGGCGRMICTKARWVKHLAWHNKDHTSSVRTSTGKHRKPRFDKGVPRRSMAAALSGMPPLPFPLEKKIISGVALNVEEDMAIRELGISDTLSKVCEASTSSSGTEYAISTQREIPLCSY